MSSCTCVHVCIYMFAGGVVIVYNKQQAYLLGKLEQGYGICHCCFATIINTPSAVAFALPRSGGSNHSQSQQSSLFQGLYLHVASRNCQADTVLLLCVLLLLTPHTADSEDLQDMMVSSVSISAH